MAKAPRNPAAPSLQGADNDPAGEPAGAFEDVPAGDTPPTADDTVPPTAYEFVVLRRVDLGAGPIEVGDALPDGLDETVLEQLRAAGVI